MQAPSTIGCNTCHTALVAVSGDKTTAINCSSRPRNKCGVTGGFTLIELSIVLVIIGLLVGGVLVGKDLIKSAEIRAQIKQIDEFKTATNAFKTKYGYLPGDMPPSETAQLGFFTFTGPYAGKICNVNAFVALAFGNNDGSISPNESIVFFQHLSQAKLVAGEYGGSPTAANYLATSTTACPGSCQGGNPVNACTQTNGCYKLLYPQIKLAPYLLDARLMVQASIYYPGISTPYFANTSLPNFFQIHGTANQEYSIDNKIDDGLPLTGTVREYWGMFGGNCNVGNLYDLSPATTDTLQFYCTLSVLW